jgi:hypothetical protein
MRALVVYESMFGNTRAIAEAVGAGLAEVAAVEVVAARSVTPGQVELADLLVVGGPTHGWTLSRPNSRKAAAKQAADGHAGLRLEPQATGPGVREWLAALPTADRQVAAFDTRLRAPRLLTGRAAPKIARALRRRGGNMVAQPESFLVTKASALVTGERERARRWGTDLGARADVRERSA